MNSRGFFKIKAADECLDTEREKKKRYHGYQDIFPPPEARAHRTFLLDDFRSKISMSGYIVKHLQCLDRLFRDTQFQCLIHLKGKQFTPAGKKRIILEQRFLER